MQLKWKKTEKNCHKLSNRCIVFFERNTLIQQKFIPSSTSSLRFHSKSYGFVSFCSFSNIIVFTILINSVAIDNVIKHEHIVVHVSIRTMHLKNCMKLYVYYKCII